MRTGYTLIELVVVIVVMGLALALVAPALAPRQDAGSALTALIARSRATAVRRAETLTLGIETTGAWRLDGVATPGIPVATGRIAPGPVAAVTYVFSPLGACAPDVAGTPAAAVALDPLTCEVASS